VACNCFFATTVSYQFLHLCKLAWLSVSSVTKAALFRFNWLIQSVRSRWYMSLTGYQLRIWWTFCGFIRDFLCGIDEGVYVDTYGKIIKNVVLQWGELPTSVGEYTSNFRHFTVIFENGNSWILIRAGSADETVFFNVYYDEVCALAI
jgi:hypothetical protein